MVNTIYLLTYSEFDFYLKNLTDGKLIIRERSK